MKGLNRRAGLFSAAVLSLGLSACSEDDVAAIAAALPSLTLPALVVEPTPDTIELEFLGRYSSGSFGVSAAEIPAYDAASRRVFVVNAEDGVLDVLSLANPANPSLIDTIEVSDIAMGAEVNSVAAARGIVAVAIQAAVKTDPGFVAFYRASNLQLLDSVQVGALPDMLIFTPDGRYLLVANEGEPSDDYTVDPEGSISVIDVTDPANVSVRTADFTAFNGQEAMLRAQGVRIFGPGGADRNNPLDFASAAKDFEPEYIAVSADSSTAWAVLQENNAFAKIDIATATVTDILPLGFKDWGLADNGFGSSNMLDLTDGDGAPLIFFQNWPGVKGIYMPDAVAAYSAGGNTFLVTANEGDARAWGEDNQNYFGNSTTAPNAALGFVEEFRVTHLVNNSGFLPRFNRAEGDLPPQLSQLAAGPAAAAGAGGAKLNHTVFAYCGATKGNAGTCRDRNNAANRGLGRLNITWTMGYETDMAGNPVKYNASGDLDANGTFLMYDELYAYGGRSFSIWDSAGNLVWDSGDQFEKYLAGLDMLGSGDICMAGSDRNIPCANFFNTGHNEGDALDSRSDAKGPEPEGVVLGKIGSKTFAFIGLERMGGVMVYDITDPMDPSFVDYLNTRENFVLDPEEPANLAAVGDLGPEGLVFIPAASSPNGEALLVVGHEVSGTTAVYQINQSFAP